MAFEWDHPKKLAVELLAQRELNLTEVARQCGITRQTLWNWQQIPMFREVVEKRLEEIRAEIRRHGIAVIEQRVARVQDTWKRLQRVMAARAIEHASVPGGDTGLLVRKYKTIGSGLLAKMVEEYEVDTGLLAELRAHEKQAAEELGQWIQKVDAVTKVEGSVKTVLHFEDNGFGGSTLPDSSAGGTTEGLSEMPC
jgi:hypothetical protein